MEAGVTGIDVAKQLTKHMMHLDEACQIFDNQAKLKENFGRIAKMLGHESGATHMIVQPIKTPNALRPLG